MIEEIPNVLACDVGNTSIRLAQVKGEQVGEVRTLRRGELNGLGELLAAMWRDVPKPRKLVVGGVSPAGLKAVEAAAAAAIDVEPLVIGRDIPLPMETDLPEPQSIGVDRLCAAVAAFDRLGVACVVADFGTAITIDCVSAEGVFLGGAILPGLEMGASGLKEGTAQLPEVSPRDPDWVFGKSTEQAISGGLVFGARGALRELVESYATELGHWPLVVCTGGDAKLVAGDVRESGLVQAIVPDLVLRGVAIAYYKTLLR